MDVSYRRAIGPLHSHSLPRVCRAKHRSATIRHMLRLSVLWTAARLLVRLFRGSSRFALAWTRSFSMSAPNILPLSASTLLRFGRDVSARFARLLSSTVRVARPSVHRVRTDSVCSHDVRLASAPGLNCKRFCHLLSHSVVVLRDYPYLMALKTLRLHAYSSLALFTLQVWFRLGRRNRRRRAIARLTLTQKLVSSHLDATMLP